MAINYWFDMKFDIKFAYFQFLENVARISRQSESVLNANNSSPRSYIT